VAESVELKIDGIYKAQNNLHHRKYILYFHGKYIKKSAADRQSDEISVPGDSPNYCCQRHQYLVLLYTSNPSRGVSTNCHSPIPCPLPVGILCHVCRTTRRHTKRP